MQFAGHNKEEEEDIYIYINGTYIFLLKKFVSPFYIPGLTNKQKKEHCQWLLFNENFKPMQYEANTSLECTLAYRKLQETKISKKRLPCE